jgi:hypothetical protein
MAVVINWILRNLRWNVNNTSRRYFNSSWTWVCTYVCTYPHRPFLPWTLSLAFQSKQKIILCVFILLRPFLNTLYHPLLSEWKCVGQGFNTVHMFQKSRMTRTKIRTGRGWGRHRNRRTASFSTSKTTTTTSTMTMRTMRTMTSTLTMTWQEEDRWKVNGKIVLNRLSREYT